MLALAALATLALVAAQDPCGPTSKPPVTSSTTAPPTSTTQPPTGGIALHPNGQSGWCIDVAGANYANGTPVQLYQCNGTGAQKFAIQRGDGKFQVAGTNFCVDAGVNPGNGSKLHLWQCYQGLPQQQWYWTADNRIALTGQGLCLDLPSGSLTNGNQLQVWQCVTGNTNQVWN
ncbi:hypothetical protein Q8F55_007240 [Vanrija albida]|uniref:Ricin B lectin domain-containing protein n=1 Tax=Vanrija albida TaxID=181172 RepID=A0ABR3PZ68_9TREE